MIFQACVWAKTGEPPWDGSIQDDCLQLAIQHVDHCLRAAAQLDGIIHRDEKAEEADILLAKIRNDFGVGAAAQNGEIELTKTQLTSKYAHHGDRKHCLKPKDLHERLIPNLIERGLARPVSKDGKKVVYAFRQDGE